MIVYIASKGRAHLKNWKKIQEAGFKVFLQVEPQDEKAYRNSGASNIVVMDKNDGGFVYARNFALDWCREKKHDWVWLVDDDVTSFGKLSPSGKTVRMGPEVLKIVYEKVKGFEFPLNGISYRQYCRGRVPAYKINKQSPDVCTLIYLPKITWRFREEMQAKCDRDFYLNSIKYSDGILSLPRYCFSCPSMGSNTGGLQEHYKAMKDVESCKQMMRVWGQYIEPTKRDGRLDIKINWKEYALKMGRKVHP